MSVQESDDSLLKAARHLAQCRQNRPQSIVDHDVVKWPSNVAEAYETQHILHSLLQEAGHKVIGHKIGCTTPVMQRYLDVPHPCAGGIYDTGLWHCSKTRPVQIQISRYRRLGLECELAVILGSKLPAGSTTFEMAAAAVATVHAAVEMVDDRYEDFERRRPPMLAWVADDFFHCGSVLSEPMPVHPRSLDTLRGTMWVGGQCMGTGVGEDIIAGHPLNALVWLANSEVAQAMGGLPCGWVVSLGSVTKTVWPKPALQTKVRVSFGSAACGPSANGVDRMPCGSLDMILLQDSPHRASL